MTIRTTSLRITLTLLGLGALAVPPLSAASSGGAGIVGGPAASPVQTATVSGQGLTVSAHVAVLLSHSLIFSGQVSRARAGRTVVIQQQAGSTWTPVATTTTGRGGAFAASWKTNRTGPLAFRATVPGGSRVSPSFTITVYRPALATFYGPGLFGRRTACGQKLTRHTLGVANRKLPCGTRVSILYSGRMIVVPVIDRGPYAHHARWDLTAATATALDMSGTATIGAAALPR
jgi:rare lipoprotein A (peptidoglycan hydrolase)